MYLKLYQVFYASSHVKLVKRAVVSSTALFFKPAFSHKRFFAYAYVQA